MEMRSPRHTKGAPKTFWDLWGLIEINGGDSVYEKCMFYI